MTNKLKIRDLNQSKTATVYIQPLRYSFLDNHARRLANDKKMDVKISHIVQFLIDEYGETGLIEFEKQLDRQKLG